jgi:hypothetical protein
MGVMASEAMNQAGVECTFAADGQVQVRRIKLEERWVAVESGRQWLDENGRHVLIMLPNNAVRELILRMDTLVWELQMIKGGRQIV